MSEGIKSLVSSILVVIGFIALVTGAPGLGIIMIIVGVIVFRSMYDKETEEQKIAKAAGMTKMPPFRPKRLRVDQRKEKSESGDLDIETSQKLINHWINQKDFKMAEKQAEKMVQTMPDVAFGWILFAELYSIQEKYEEAIETIEKAIELHPNNYKALELKGRALFGLERIEEAEKAVKKSLDIYPNNFDLWLAMISILEKKEEKKFEEIELAYRHADHLAPDDFEHKGYLQERIAKLSQASFDVISKMRVFHAGPEEYAESALQSLEEGELIRAARTFTVCIQWDPTIGKIWGYLGLAQEMRGDFEEALKSYEKSLELDPSLSESWVGIGKIMTLQGKEKEQEEAFKKAIELNPEDIKSKTALLGSLANQKKYDEAVKLFEELKEINDETLISNAWVSYGSMLTKIPGREEEGEEALKKAVELEKGQTIAKRLLAINYFLEGKNEETIELMERVVKEKQENLENWMMLTQAYMNIGDKEEAKRTLREAEKYAIEGTKEFYQIMNTKEQLKQTEV
ncbi:MAG: tetratricopeptide repeat protein [Candidatus Kariarchaeaceae archaeon]